MRTHDESATRRTKPGTWLGAAVLAVLALLLSACSSGTSTDSSGNPGSGAPTTEDAAVSGELVVFAAASLKESFDEIVTLMAEEYPDLTITMQYGASGQLATQIQQGAPADVFASADPVSMEQLTTSGEIADSSDFARNQLTIVVPKDNPGGVESLQDLTNPDLTIVTCAEAAACGKITATLEADTGLTIATDSQEPDVKSVLQKVVLGEADAGLVYVTDVSSAGDAVKGVDLPEAEPLSNTYPIGPVEAAANPDAAAAFIDFVLSPAGQQVLADRGFLAP